MLKLVQRILRAPSIRRAALVACLCVPPAASAQFTFQPLPDIGSNGLLKISADGQTVAGSARANGIEQAALWTVATGTVRLGSLAGGDGSSLGLGLSADGHFVVGRSSSANGLEAFLWSAGSGMVALGDLPGSSVPFNSAATGVSADGSVVVGQSVRVDNWRAFRWTASGGMVDLGHLGAGFSAATAVSRNGLLVAGTSRSASAQEAFRWTPSSGMLALGQLPSGGQTIRATAISGDGKVIVGVGADSSFQAFRWTQSTGVIALGTFDPRNPGSSAAGVSANGRVIVGMGSGVDADGNGEAFVWFPGRGMLDLRQYLLAHGVAAVQAWRLAEATGVSDDGRTLVGWGINPQGAASGWLAHIDIDDTLSPPAAPGQLAGNAKGSKVVLKWADNADNEAGFQVERCAGKGCLNFAQIAQVGADRSPLPTRLSNPAHVIATVCAPSTRPARRLIQTSLQCARVSHCCIPRIRLLQLPAGVFWFFRICRAIARS